MDVTGVFPERFYVLVKEVDGIAEGQGGDVEVVVDVPEGADVGDGSQVNQSVFVVVCWFC